MAGVNIIKQALKIDKFEIITNNNSITDKNQLNAVITGSNNVKSNANENIQPVCMSITKSIINNRVNCYSKKVNYSLTKTIQL